MTGVGKLNTDRGRENVGNHTISSDTCHPILNLPGVQTSGFDLADQLVGFVETYIYNLTIQEEITDEALHSKLLKGLGVQQKKRKVKEKILPVEPTDKEIEGSPKLGHVICKTLFRQQ